MEILNTAAQNYMATFSGYTTQFLQWGEWLFFSLLIIQITWLALWCAFDRHALAESLPAFLKRFFVAAFFYTLMVNQSWLLDVLKTAKAMGGVLAQAPIDPSSLISMGIGIGNKIIAPLGQSSLLMLGFGAIIVGAVYVVVLFTFVSIALELALTLIMTTALISTAAFFLGFAALGATMQIARQILDTVLANCVKLLGIYLVAAAGGQTINAVAAAVPTRIESFDPYVWIAAVALLFWLLAKNLPNQMAKIVTLSFQEPHGTDSAALALSTVQYAKTTVAAAKATLGASKWAANKLKGAVAHLRQAHAPGAQGHAPPISKPTSKPGQSAK